MFTRFKKFSAAILVGLLVVTSAAAVLRPEPAFAFSSEIITSIPDTITKILNQVYQGLKKSVLTAVSKLVSYGIRKIAYDGAVWLASGGKGQGAMAQSKGFGDYLKNVGDDAVGVAIEELGKGIGFNLCKIPDIKLDATLKIGLRTGFGDSTNDLTQKPSCSFTQFQKEWLNEDAWKTKYGSTESLSERFTGSLKVDDSGLGAVLKTTEQVNSKVKSQLTGKMLERQEGQGFLPKVTNISNQVLTPSALIKKGFEDKMPSNVQKSDEEQVQTLLASGEISVIPNVLGIFLNTLVSTMVKNYQEKGMLPFGISFGGGGGNANVSANYDSSGLLMGIREAQNVYSSFLVIDTGAPSEYDILGELGNCSDEANGTYNCRADEGLKRAAGQSNNGQPVTILEAIKDGTLLHGEWELIPLLGREADNMELKGACSQAYCYANIQVLRQARILPLGFEIAAKLSNPDHPWKLAEVVGNGKDTGFYDCGKDPKTGKIVYDPANHPFCHLIDPNWIIKAPPARCDAKVNGAVSLSKDVPTRVKECNDLKSCVAFAADGKTCLTYAYCGREKNIWKIPGNSCQPQFSTCRTFTNITTQQTASYLYRSVDTNYCDGSTAGCREYSLNQGIDSNGNWNWLEATIPNSQNNFINNGIYFNKNLPAAACANNTAGCTAFYTANDLAQPLYLRKAPAYNKCYDTKLNTPEIDWPRNQGDLLKLPKGGACAEYAPACIKDEVGCDWFTDLITGDKIPGKATLGVKVNNLAVWNDQCDASCVGYDAYQEMPSNYASGQDLTYIIPGSDVQCNREDAGCASFTNLGSTNNGLEQVEYYSYLRPCSLPSPQGQKNFITYEGKAAGGFQLQVYNLVPAGDGSPKYFYRTDAELQEYLTTCTAEKYKNGAVGDIHPDWAPDCRQFNDEAGHVYYRLLSKTIPVSEQCASYRLNKSELYATNLNEQKCAEQKGLWKNNLCSLCYLNGEYKDGSCFYQGLPGGVVASNDQKSATCSAPAETCRQYKGSGANNVKKFGVDTFENIKDLNQLPNWSGQNLAISLESTHANEHSLQGSGQGQVFVRAMVGENAPIVGRTYGISFWAKGTGSNLAVTLETNDGDFTGIFGIASLGDTWQLFRLNSGTVTGPKLDVAVDAKVIFTSNNNGVVFLDNVAVTEDNDSYYFVKNALEKKLQNSPFCDATPNDNLPGEALGCRAYNGPGNKPVNLKNFSYLCRENAIGCTELWDSQNTLTNNAVTPQDQGPQIHKLWLPGAGGTTVNLNYRSKIIASCIIPVGLTGCYAEVIKNILPEYLLNKDFTELSSGLDLNLMFTPSTVYIPADTPSDLPIYLVNSPTQPGLCQAQDVGCAYAGLMQPTPGGVTFATYTIKNDPELYKDSLCVNEALGCQEYSQNQGSVFFKDPLITGQKICAYNAQAVVKDNNGQTQTRSGWFWKDVGVCSNNNNILCQADADCGGKNTCNKSVSVPCYKNYILNDGSYGLQSFGDTDKYQNFVGECDAKDNMCSEFLDPNDNNAAQYFINDPNKINESDCGGQVSIKNGCVLFDETANPAKYWSAALSYKISDDNEGRLVAPINDKNTNDANKIIKVTRDRVCGEWLQCRLWRQTYNSTENKYTKECDRISRCNEAAVGNKTGEQNCANYIDGQTASAGDYPDTVLDEKFYVENKPVGWSGMDYAGYSILGSYPLEELSQINLSADPSALDWRLVKLINCGKDNQDINCVSNQPTYQCKTNNNNCGSGGAGWCINGKCVQNFNGQANAQVFNNIPNHICRGYPEEDSPFPNTADLLPGADARQITQQFTGIKVCQETPGVAADIKLALACDCDYTKVNYGDSLIKYWNYYNPNLLGTPVAGKKDDKDINPQGLCIAGDIDYIGLACSTNADCAKDKVAGAGVCQPQTKKTAWVGWRGFCIENDNSHIINANQNSHPCLTWYPVDSLLGTIDINEQHSDAAYNTQGNPLYCLNTFDLNYFDKHWKYANPIPEHDQFKNWWFTRMKDNTISYVGQGVPAAPGLLTFDSVGTEKDPNPKEWKGNNFEQNTLEDAKDSCSGAPNPGAFALCVDKVGTDNQFRRQFFPAGRIENEIKMADVQSIEFNVSIASLGEYDPRQGVKFEIWPNDFKAKPNENKAQSWWTTKVSFKGDDKSFGSAAFGRYLGKTNEFILFYSSASEYLKDPASQGIVCFGANCQYLSGNIFAPNGLKHNNNLTPFNNDGIWDRTVKNSDICPYGAPGSGNWHAIRLVFNKDTGLFEGYYTAYCDASEGKGASISYQVIFKMKEWCQAVANTQTNYAGPANSNSVAFANRLWQQNQKNPYTVVYGSAQSKQTSINYASLQPPFGALQTLSLPDNPWQQMFTTEVTLTPCKEEYYKDEGSCHLNIVSPQIGDGGTPYVAPQAQQNIYNIFGNLFARPSALSEFNPALDANNVYTGYQPKALFNFTKTGVIGSDGQYKPLPPRIYPLGKCESGLTSNCVEDRTRLNSISVNGKTGDVKILNSDGLAVIQFFAYAADDQMPIRRLKIDWGDDSSIIDKPVLFQNHRGLVAPVCQQNTGECGYYREQVVGKGVVSNKCDVVICSNKAVCDDETKTCQEFIATGQQNCKFNSDCKTVNNCVADPVSFGYLNNKSCVNTYYTSGYTYQCFDGAPKFTRDGCGDGFSNGCCIYYPRVQVTDNWGWCNGSCEANSGGCYDGNDDENGAKDCDSSPKAWSNNNIKVIVAPKL